MGLRLRNGKWIVRKNIDGVRHEESTGYPEKDRRKAELAMTKMVSRWLDEKHGLAPKPQEDEGEAPTLGEWWSTYRTTYGPLKGERTARADVSRMRPWLALPFRRTGRTWEATPLDDFRQSDCLAGLNARLGSKTVNPFWKQQKVVKSGTIRRERGLVQSVFERAMQDRLIAFNPWRGIPRGKDQVRERVLTADEEVKLLAHLSPRYQRFVTLLLETGLRLNGLRTLDLNHIRLDEGSVHASEKSVKHDNYCRVCRVKGQKCRNVPLTERAKTAIKEQLAADGDLWRQDPQYLREVMATAATAAGIPNVTPHDLRHTFGHRYVTRGGDLKTLSKILGHANIAVTDRHYSALFDEDISARMLAVMGG